MKHVLGILAFASLVGCGGGTVTDTPGPTTPVDTTKPPTKVQRASLTVRVSVDPADAAIASTAGLPMSGITVRISRTTPGVAPLTGTTGADGTVRFDNLLEGVYAVAADRALTTSEINRLAVTDRDVSIFAGGGERVMSPPANASVDVAIVANRRGSIIISELFPFNNPATTTLGYNWGTYLEVYNNSDTTAYLDGILMFRTPLGLHRNFPPFPCEQYNQAQREDGTAILSSSVIHQFPGRGRDYPILPGEAKVVAVDAMDHNAANPGMQQPDLSNAAFEQHGSDADIDNAFVPNLIRVTAGEGFFGRGYPYTTASIAYVLAMPAARDAMTTVQLINTLGTGSGIGSGAPYDVYRFPRELVLDVFSVTSSPDQPGYVVAQSQVLQCTPFLASVFERAPAPLVNTTRSIAISRKTASRTAAGKEILQRTRTSARDLEYHEPLLRSLRK